MSVTFQETVCLTRMQCGDCGVTFAMPEVLHNDRYNNGGTWYCPNGHPRVFGETEVQRLQRALDAKKRREEILEAEAKRLKEQRDSAERRESAAKGQMTKLKNRSKNGVCPCCNRTFVNMQRHMKTKHPEFHEASP